VHVHSIRFEGHHELAGGERLKTQVDSWSFFGLFGATFNPVIIDNDCIKLEEYFKDHGYINVHVSRELAFTPDHSGVDITFHVQDGERHKVKNHVIEGNKVIDSGAINKIIQVKDGSYFDGAKATGDAKNIQDMYGWRGYSTVVNREVYTVPGEPGV